MFAYTVCGYVYFVDRFSFNLYSNTLNVHVCIFRYIFPFGFLYLKFGCFSSSFFNSGIVVYMIQLLWSCVILLRNGFAMEGETLLAGGGYLK